MGLRENFVSKLCISSIRFAENFRFGSNDIAQCWMSVNYMDTKVIKYDASNITFGTGINGTYGDWNNPITFNFFGPVGVS